MYIEVEVEDWRRWWIWWWNVYSGDGDGITDTMVEMAK